MRTSEEIKDLAEALAKAQSRYTPVKKDKTGKIKGTTKSGSSYEYEYKYADLADVLQMALPILSSEGLAFSQPNILVDGKLRVASRLMHLSGQWMESDGVEMSEEGTPQAFGIESTYFRRYDGCSLLGIAPDEDTDAQMGDDRSRRKTPDPVQDQTQKRNSQPADNKPHEAEFRIEGNRLTFSVIAVEKKHNAKNGRDYLVVWPDGTIKGHDRISVWDDKLFEHLLGKAHGKVCSFEFATSADGKYWSIKKVLSVGEDVIEDGPPDPPASEAGYDYIPF